jgi:septum site-determining protein MinC
VSTSTKPSIRIKGRSFVALVLMPESPVEDWLDALASQMARSPTFFDGRPVIVDFSALAGQESAFESIIARLEQRDMRIIGVEGAAPGWTDSDVWGRPPIATNGRADRFVEIVEEIAEPPPPPEPTSLVLRGPIRSGQSVFFEKGDVTVLGSVSSGAEVIAGGSIHVYGTLRGRAIAGFTQPSAGVFCRRLEAELIAINGIYKTADDISPLLRGKSVHATLEGDSVVLVSMT